MTASARRRQRLTLAAGGLALAMLLVAAALTAVGVSAVRNSTAGQEVQADPRPVVELPETDNAAIAVIDDDRRLVSLVVATVRPDGAGGTLVTVPVAADANGGFGDEPVSLVDEFDPDQADAFFQRVESALAITLQHVEVVDGDRLGQLLAPVLPASVDLPFDVVEVAGDPDGASQISSGELLVAEGVQELDATGLMQLLSWPGGEALERTEHFLDVVAWSGVEALTPAQDVQVPLDDVGRPVPSTSVDEVFARLWSGSVQVRDLAIADAEPDSADSVVLLDRLDVVLVFAQISPARVSTPNQGPVFRIEIPISDQQVQASDAEFDSIDEVGRSVIAQVLFVSANVASVDLTASGEDAPAVTQMIVDSESDIAGGEALAATFFGDIEVVVAEDLIDGIDLRVRLGTDYLSHLGAPSTSAAGQQDGSDDGADTSGSSTPSDAVTVGTDG